MLYQFIIVRVIYITNNNNNKDHVGYNPSWDGYILFFPQWLILMMRAAKSAIWFDNDNAALPASPSPFFVCFSYW